MAVHHVLRSAPRKGLASRGCASLFGGLRYSGREASARAQRGGQGGTARCPCAHEADAAQRAGIPAVHRRWWRRERENGLQHVAVVRAGLQPLGRANLQHFGDRAFVAPDDERRQLLQAERKRTFAVKQRDLRGEIARTILQWCGGQQHDPRARRKARKHGISVGGRRPEVMRLVHDHAIEGGRGCASPAQGLMCDEGARQGRAFHCDTPRGPE